MTKLSYEPIKLCDTAGMSESDWLKLREHGPHFADPSHPDYIPVCIGGSTVSAVLGINPWTTPLEVWESKKGLKPDNPDEMNAEAKIAGHVWEDFVAQMVPHMDGFETAKVENDTGFYQHPLYPFAVVNLDRIMYLNGEKTILEIKTTNWRNFEKIKQWKDGIVPLYYEYQVRWYMAVMNLDTAYICCAWGFTTNDMVILKIERDYEIERFLFDKVSDFIVSIEKNEPPTMEGIDPELAMQALSRLYSSNSSIPEIEFDPKKYGYAFKGLKEVLEQEAELKEEMSERMAAIDKRKKFFSAKICAAMKRAEVGFVEIGGEKISVSYKTTTRTGVDSQRLRKEDPEIFDKYKKTTSYRTLKLLDE